MSDRVEQTSRRAAAPAAAPTAIAGDAGFSMMAKLLYLLTRVGVPPMVLAHVSLTEYGLWAACFVLVGYVAFADLGFSSVYVRSAARLHAGGDIAGIGRLLSTGIIFMALLSTVLFAVIALFLPALMDLLKVPAAQRELARGLILGSVAVFLFDISLNAFSYVLHGMQRFRAEQKVWVLAFLFELALIALFLYAGLGVFALLLAFALRYVFSVFCNMWQVYRALPGLAVGPRQFDRRLLPHFLGFGLSVQASNMFAMALHSADRLVSGALLGPHAIALFDLGGKLPVSTTSVPAAISQVTLPAAARLSPDTERETLRRLYAQATRAVSMVAALPLAFFAAFSIPVSYAWLGARPELEVVPLVMTLAAVGAYAHIVTGPGSSVFRGIGKVGNEFVYHALRIAGLGASLALACFTLGTSVRAISFGLAGGTVAAACAYLAHNQRRLGLRLAQLLTRAALPAAAVFAVAYALSAVWHAYVPASLGRWETLAALAAFAAVHGLLSLAVIWLLLDEGERDSLMNIAGRFVPPLTQWRTT